MADVPAASSKKSLLLKRKRSQSANGQADDSFVQAAIPVDDAVASPAVRLEMLLEGERAILSVDFAAEGKLVTAGQDGRVKIWQVTLSSQDTLQPTWLCTLNHDAAVNCARWAPDGKMLASCDAQAALLVWSPGLGDHLPLQDLQAPEPWHRHCLLRGHQGEVCDVSWHPNLHPDLTLASCSHDGTVRLWSVARAELSQVLRPDSGYIKGVSFDPLGQYLACMSDGDGSRLCAMLYEVPEELRGPWRQVPLSQAPWERPGLLTAAVNFRRPAWDPLGQAVVFPFGEHKRCAQSSCRFYAALFAQPAWAPKLYRGHSEHVAVARFSPAVPTRKFGFGPAPKSYKKP